MSENRKENKIRGKPYLDLPGPLAGLALCRPSQLASASRPPPHARGTGRVVAARRAHARHGSCLPALSPLRPGLARSAQLPSSLTPSLLRLSSPISRSLPRRPNTPESAAARRRGHSLPLASPSCPRAPPLWATPPRRDARRRTPWNAAITIVFLLGLRRPPPPIRRHRVFPEHAEATSALAVSPSSSPLFSQARGRSLASFPMTAENISPPAMV